MGVVRWQSQGGALVGDVLVDAGTPARVVLVGPRSAPKGAILVTASKAGGDLYTQPLFECLGRLSAAHLLEVVCMQERLFGASGLPALAPE